MKTLLLRLALVAALAFAAFTFAAPVAAQEGGGPTQAGETRDILPVALWSIAGVALGAVVMGTLYLFKRQVGGFPENPSWTAPISIMRSRDLPGDEDLHGHGDPHDPPSPGHAPAH